VDGSLKEGEAVRVISGRRSGETGTAISIYRSGREEGRSLVWVKLADGTVDGYNQRNLERLTGELVPAHTLDFTRM
jgi:hypothetical protein